MRVRLQARTFSLALSGVVAAAVLSSPFTAAAAPVKKVLVVGMDGLNWAKVVSANAPNLDALAAGGSLGESLLYCPSVAASSSGPGWSTIATGVWPDKHGVKDNSFAGKQYATYPDFLTRLERVNPAYRTYSAVDWAVLHSQGTFSSSIDTRVTYDGDRDGYVVSDEKITADTVRNLRDGNPDASFVYLGNTDVVAHASGTGAPYAAAIEKQDAQLGQLLGAVKARPTYANEDWLVVVATDHGHNNPGGGHGGCGVSDERRTFVLAKGSGIAAGARPVDTRLADVSATVFNHLGVAADPAWKLDSKPVSVRSRDAFDSLYGSLSARVDETGIPATVKGWTHTAPAGWSVDRSRMPSGGVTEWRGWSFTTDEFWTRAQASQERENAMRTRGVFAVADSDEFADKTGGTSFDSTLVSPAYPVTAGGGVTLNYVTHYLQEGSQTGDVSVSFNGGADQLVKRYSADARAKAESLPVTVPAGATSMVVKFRYHNANNNWYWAIDDLRVG
ncbi:nucleotide pyrophosphatase [Actinosynnema sp. ALI-1.44]|uniref:alkaline phosphatase family protein n=1 Tax=Actinosynnema sp. ALI-1.44 TaxID=1933779 RepID=UPI00097C9BF2|nr:alkaline phosphatase family protein [Actinosynnema sp. ALI-1.44]ONI87419.1 nucleotide pyrophosphatase [Actinosynnema sp. ALI-1.44]